jgi:putative nucleotidyltransferase with HDIG domain
LAEISADSVSFPLIRRDARSRTHYSIVKYLVALAAATLCLVAGLVAGGSRPDHFWAVGTLACIAALSEHGRVQLSRTTESSISLLPILFAAVLFGPLNAMIVGAASLLLGDFSRPYMKCAVYTLSRSLTAGLTGIATSAAGGYAGGSVGKIAAATAVGAVVSEVLDMSFAAVTHRLRGNGSMRNMFRLLMPLTVASVPVYAPVIALLALAYNEVSVWTLPLFFVPALAAQHLYGLYQEQRELAEGLASANARLERANLSFATALVATLDARDRYTAGHSAAVAIYARDIARRMGLSDADQQRAHLCGLVHDVGKIGLPPGLLEKPGSLTLDERRLMETHAEIGERILANVDDYAEIAHIVRHHHERVDGLGYPDGLASAEIPLLSRIIAVADAYNAMTSDRPYRDAMPSPVARLRLAQAVESQFDTTVVAAFEAILAGANDQYRAGNRKDFEFRAEATAVEAVSVG